MRSLLKIIRARFFGFKADLKESQFNKFLIESGTCDNPKWLKRVAPAHWERMYLQFLSTGMIKKELSK